VILAPNASRKSSFAHDLHSEAVHGVANSCT
jgi:hypothetical protein